jgi:triacylglycerol lipase
MIPIVFLHGFGGGRYEFQPIIRFLKKHGFLKFYEFTYVEKFGEVHLTELEKKFSDFIKNNVKEKNIIIIGISQGGIIARIFLGRNKNKIVEKCITLCTPHNGSLSAYLLKRKGFLDLRPNSELLSNLNNSDETKLTFYSVYTPFDLMVFPGWNAKFSKAKENKRVFALLHPLAFWCKPTLRFILKSLND